MISYIPIKELSSRIGQRVTIVGFVHALRDQNKIVFLNLRDRTGIVQCISFHTSDSFEQVRSLNYESVIKVEGQVKEAPQAPNGFEVDIEKIEILSVAAPELPIPVNIQKGGGEIEQPTRLDFRWLDLRQPEKTRIFEVWGELEKGFRAFWDAERFMQIYTPSFMSTPSETGAEVFEVNYFEKKAYLAQSPQFYKQMAIASGFERVFMTGPVFRAELSFTTRHLTEFTGWDFEVAYIDSHHDIMDLEEGMIISGFESVKKAFPEISIEIPKKGFPRIPIAEVKDILAKRGIESSEEHDLSPEEERVIAEYVKEVHNHDFVFITDYHKSKSAFYHMRLEEGSDRSRRADLLYRGLEVTTLAQREHRPEILEKQAIEKGMGLEALSDYLNFFKYGCPPHGGAGIGPARFVMKMLDLPNVREATYLPRDVKRLNP